MSDANAPSPVRLLFVFAWLVVGGEETEVRLLARHLDPKRYVVDVVACFHRPGMTEQTRDQLIAAGIDVDTTPYELSFEDTVGYLASKIPNYDIVISCQNVADIYPAYERLHLRPPLIEHGGLVSEALAGPKHFTARYVGVCRSIRDAAASKMPRRPHHALEIPSMVDLPAFRPSVRPSVRAMLKLGEDDVLIGWVGRLDRKKKVENFIEAAAIVHSSNSKTRFIVVGGPDAFMPDYEVELKHLARQRGLDTVLTFLGDRDDVPDLMAAMDIFAWLSTGEGMPHVIAEAGAAALAVVATADNGSIQQITDGTSGYFVPHDDAAAAAARILMLSNSPEARIKTGAALRRRVESEYSVEAVVPMWLRLFREVLAERPCGIRSGLFASFMQVGFECSTHRLRAPETGIPGKRLDLIASTGHDVMAEQDYNLVSRYNIRTVRDGFRWHLVENSPGQYDCSSALPMVRAAANAGTQVIWDLLHYGWPDHIDPWRPEFVGKFARFAKAAASLIRGESDETPFYSPINEISFLAWAGGDAGYLNPFGTRRGFELKVQLARAAIAAMDAILEVDARARFVHCDPVINIPHDPSRPHERSIAEGHRQAQFQAWDMLCGRAWPQLGGDNRYLDIIGVNYYSNNQWLYGGETIDTGHSRYKPFRYFLTETYARYGRPIFVAETGIEGDRRASWLAYMGDEINEAMRAGVPMEGICLYPIINHLGWDDDRPCENGLFSWDHTRTVHLPLADELSIQSRRFGN
ncbi:glycosyltransferase [Phyllobacterium sp. UNC302MFCol5.2]|uniref:glycosyltransferase n=1 Tax=Phyllobacterium sp. UNC302MFCol5.2 TaxID=1449065 RepID=UPI0005650ED6|nr:glycosyltransferase [Phyllobacterium sp. UNC302MFCol5.2]